MDLGLFIGGDGCLIDAVRRFFRMYILRILRIPRFGVDDVPDFSAVLEEGENPVAALKYD